MKKKLLNTIIGCGFAMAVEGADACSALFIKQADGNGNVVNVINARSMDFPSQFFYLFGFGAVGAKNVSDVNFVSALQNSDAQVATWSNTHKFVGRLAFSRDVIVDGINDAGLYAGYLFLPDFTNYPTYDPGDSRKALAVLDTANFVLGNAGSVDDAVALLRSVQVVNSAAQLSLNGKDKYVNMPLHLVLRDKGGNAGLVEFTNGKMQIYVGLDVNPVTNGPAYPWQVDNFNKQSARWVQHNTDQKWDGHYMNGSGLTGLPGAFIPPDRFVRAKQMLKFAPNAQTHEQAMVLAKGFIESVKVPFGVDGSPTIFVSLSDLANNIYYYQSIMSYMMSGAAEIKVVLAPGADDPAKWDTVRLNDLDEGNLPAGYIVTRTVRHTSYIDPKSPEVSYNAGISSTTGYAVQFLTPDQFTEELIDKTLFK